LAKQISVIAIEAHGGVWAELAQFPRREEFSASMWSDGNQERLPPMCNLRIPKDRPMSAPKTTVAMIAAPCAPSACHGVEIGHAMRQPALIARPAPAPYRAPAIAGRVASELRNSLLKSKTRIPPAIVLPIPQAKPMIHGESRSSSETRGGRKPGSGP